MVFHEEQLLGGNVQLGEDLAFDPQLFIEPGDHGFAEDLPGAREGLQRGHQDTLEFQERFFVEDDIV